ncbi:MAG: hypothetical protein ACYDCL_13440 [Myxococcales bacterium]
MRLWLPSFAAAAIVVSCQCQNTTGAGSGGGSSTGTAGASAGHGSGDSTGGAGSTGAAAGSSSGATAGATAGSSTGSPTGGASGSSTGSSTGGCPVAFTSLTLSPQSSSVTLDGSSPAPITFTVTGTDAQGQQQSVDPSLLTWTATREDDTNPGSVSNGVFTPYGGAGGTVTVTATGCGASGSATVTFTLDETLTTDGGVPADFADAGAPGSQDAGSPDAPVLIYPSAETRFPRNVYKILFQWKANGQSEFRLTFTGAGSTVTVYTDGQDPTCAGVAGAACWQADSASWDAIAGSNAGGTVQVEVDGTAGAGAPVYLGAPETIGFSKLDVLGAIFYWAANRGGIERATISDAQPQDYLVGPNPGPATQVDGYTIQCAACHTVSRDGQKMAASVQAQGPTNVHGAWVMQVTVNPPPLPLVTSIPGATGDGYSAFSPDTTKLVWGPRNGGQLTLIDATTGATISSISVGGTAVTGSAVDWSPDGGLIAYADTKGGISTVAVESPPGTFSGVSQIVKPAGGGGPGPGAAINDFPMFDPEGDWIAYTNTADLFLVPSGGGTPIELTAANTVVNNSTATPPKENSMPTWAPPGDLHWIAFNSQRPYGFLNTKDNNQLWVAGIDFGKLAGGGGDPSYPAFWLPFQTLTDLNHRAFWTLDVRTQLPDGGLIPDGGFVPDSGFQDGGPGDAGPDGGGSCFEGPCSDGGAPACVPFGDSCDPVTSTCCDPTFQGNYCGLVSDGGTVCEAPAFH